MGGAAWAPLDDHEGRGAGGFGADAGLKGRFFGLCGLDVCGPGVWAQGLGFWACYGAWLRLVLPLSAAGFAESAVISVSCRFFREFRKCHVDLLWVWDL
jgi:hypothetical protein